MEIQGKIVSVLPILSGEGRNGTWRKQEFVIETSDQQYPKKICFSQWGDNIDKANVQENELVKVFFDVESREYNGRWYTDCKAWRVDKMQATATAPTGDANVGADIAIENNNLNELDVEDDLPF